MKQAPYSLLTLCPNSFMATQDAPVFLDDNSRANRRHLTPFHVHWESFQKWYSVLPGWPCPPRSYVRSRLGEGRIRSLQSAIWFVVFAFLTVISFSRPLFCAGRVEISLKEMSTVQPSGIFLKDIADLKGLDSHHLWKLAQVRLGPSPPFGVVFTLSRHQVSKLVEAGTGSIPGAHFQGAVMVQVRLQGRQVEPSEVVPILKSYLLETTPWEESEIEIRSVKSLEGIEVPPGPVTLRISPKTAILGHGTILAPVDVLQGGETLSCFWVTAEIAVHARIVTAARKIAFGKTIALGDIVEASTEIVDYRNPYVRRAEDVVGKASCRSFSAGEPLTREAFADPFLVNNGETVRLRLERNGIVLTSLVRAEQNGRLGQVIRVRNLDFSTLLKAEVTGRAEVRIQ